jgi:replicative DNA helicase
MEMDIEAYALGSIMLMRSKFEVSDVLDILKPEYFTVDKNKSIYEAIKAANAEGQTPETVTVWTFLKRLGHKIEPAYLTGLTQHIATDAKAEFYSKLLAEKWYGRETKKILEDSAKKLNRDMDAGEVETIKTETVRALEKLDLWGGIKLVDYPAELERMEENMERRDGKLDGYSWGLIDLDSWTGGIEPGKLYVIGALKKAGKTRFAIFLRKILYKQGIATPFLSLEVPPYEVAKLTMSAFTGIEDLKFRAQSKISPEEKAKYYAIKKKINFDLLPTECIAGIEIPEVLQRIRYYSKRYPKCVVILDYVQRIEHDENNQAIKLEKYSRQIADTVRKTKTGLLLLSQLKNLAEEKSREPGTGDLKGSGGIGEAADAILILDNIYRRTEEEGDKNKMTIKIEQRYGDKGRVNIITDLSKCSFKNGFTKDFPEGFEGRPVDNRYNNDKEIEDGII